MTDEAILKRCLKCNRVQYLSDWFDENGLCQYCNPSIESKEAHDLVNEILKAGDSPEPLFSRAQYVMAVRYLFNLLNPSLRK